jgi:hypothetical protein
MPFAKIPASLTAFVAAGSGLFRVPYISKRASGEITDAVVLLAEAVVLPTEAVLLLAEAVVLPTEAVVLLAEAVD